MTPERQKDIARWAADTYGAKCTENLKSACRDFADNQTNANVEALRAALATYDEAKEYARSLKG